MWGTVDWLIWLEFDIWWWGNAKVYLDFAAEKQEDEKQEDAKQKSRIDKCMHYSVIYMMYPRLTCDLMVN